MASRRMPCLDIPGRRQSREAPTCQHRCRRLLSRFLTDQHIPPCTIGLGRHWEVAVQYSQARRQRRLLPSPDGDAALNQGMLNERCHVTVTA